MSQRTAGPPACCACEVFNGGISAGTLAECLRGDITFPRRCINVRTVLSWVSNQTLHQKPICQSVGTCEVLNGGISAGTLGKCLQRDVGPAIEYICAISNMVNGRSASVLVNVKSSTAACQPARCPKVAL